MTPEQKEKWVAALRSGEYRQGYRQLELFDGRFCCLGVARKVIGVRKLPKEEFLSKSFLPLDTQEELANLNDLKLLNFREIADYIEENL